MLEVKIKKTLPEFNIAVEFSVDNEILVILGPSGAGKTMTLKCIAGLIHPDEGFVKLNGKILFDSRTHINIPARQRKMGFLFQNYALFPHMTVNENIAFGIRHLTRQKVNERVSWLLEKMNIQGLGQRFPAQLSSGQQQRVALARALSHEPEVLLFDEPFSSLDTPRKERLELEILSLQSFYKGDILFITHDLIQGYKLASRIAIFESGRIVQCDTKHKVIESPANYTVARLTGVKNLMKGHIARVKDREVWVMIPQLGDLLKVIIKKDANFSIKQIVTVGIRPEYIQFVNNHHGENIFLCTVNQIIEGVTNFNYILHKNSDTDARFHLEASLSKSGVPDIEQGKSYHLYLPPELLAIIK
ncbi:MAG: sulfate/molybdate ABC transporter ATP-binding protein [Candidatus Humimicrobiaceae bacterium]